VTEGRPDWWHENGYLREQLDLSEYQPPRFADGTYTHEVTDEIEKNHDCRLQFIGINTRYLDDWEVRINGKAAFKIGRYRDDQGNTVYEISAEKFREMVKAHISE
jgi:hypothetical protein